MNDEKEESEFDLMSRNFCEAEKYDGDFSGRNRGIVKKSERENF